MKQRVYTPEEYAAMGYKLRDDYDLVYGKPDAPLKDDPDPFFSYRADSKEEVAKDVIFLGVDIALIFVGGPLGRVARSSWPFFKEVF